MRQVVRGVNEAGSRAESLRSERKVVSHARSSYSGHGAAVIFLLRAVLRRALYSKRVHYGLHVMSFCAASSLPARS